MPASPHAQSGPSPRPRAHFETLAPYTPGEQPARDQPVVKLNTNEAPFPPRPAVLAAVRGLSGEAMRRYPPPDAAGFRAAAADAHGLSPEQVIATNGGDELLRLVITVFCEPTGNPSTTSAPGPPAGQAAAEPRDPEDMPSIAAADNPSGGIGLATPTYSLYDVLAAIHGTPVTEVPRGDGFALPEPQALAKAWNDAGCRVGFVVNPHAPSGRLDSLDALRALGDGFDGLLVVDEAYVDFAQRDALDLLRVDRRRNVLILRSLSKGYAMAGVRFGYGLGDASLIGLLHKARDSYNTDALSQAAATAAITRRADHGRLWDAVRAERRRLTLALRERGFDVPDSHSNFVLAGVPGSSGGGPADARGWYQALKARGVLVRFFDADRLRDKLRITVGTPAQTDTLLRALDAELGKDTPVPPADAGALSRRGASVRRTTNETDITLELDLDGGAYRHATGVGFFDHMLDHVAKHGRLGLRVTCHGDTHVDDHHTVEDVGLALGDALKQALGDKRGLERYGSASVPMDDALARVSLDLSGRPALVFNVTWTKADRERTSTEAGSRPAAADDSGAPGGEVTPWTQAAAERDPAAPAIAGQSMRSFDLQLVEEFFNAVANAAAMNLHIETPWGRNNHHLAEAIFKAFGRALREAVAITGDDVPSTKGTL